MPPSASRPGRCACLNTRVAMGIAVVLLLFAAGFPFDGRAAEKGQTITLGESLNDFQRTELLDFFKTESDDRVITITVSDTLEAMAGISMAGTISSAYSSTALKCRDLGDGLDVTTRNITVVTPDLYAIALVTAGIGDATLVVAAPVDLSAQGMTALAGIFKTWNLAPCTSGNTNADRQRLALEQIAIAAAIGQYLTATGIADGVQRAGNVVLEAQKNIVTERLREPADIDAAITAQEQIQGVAIPSDLRAQLVDLMTRLAREKIDWSTFSAGWTIERAPGNQRITMTGEGIAVRNARASATAQAKAELTATAQAAANMTATAGADSANATATARAAADRTATANAQATELADAALTATALAQPTITATPAPIALRGEIVEADTGSLVIKPVDGSRVDVRYAVAGDAVISRDGQSADAGALRKGDAVELTINGATQEIVEVVAQPPPAAGRNWIGILSLFLVTGTVGSAFIWVRRSREEPFIITLRSSESA